MELGLEHSEVRIVDYTDKWADEFEKVKQGLIDSTGLEDERIEHIGSTAIKGMPAKPIIDILVGVNDLNSVDKSLFQCFGKEGFLRLKVERSGEIVLAKFKDDSYQVKTHFIHLVEYRKQLWDDLIFFRDYLNENEEARRQYLNIKEEFLNNKSEGILEYTDFKEAFVKRIISENVDGI
ncbi:dephospho-CoA kinase/protein folding accessory domain-containing protein [Jeotgalicoccus saudimassiliensis]|uniref:Dephospho-CoA kinase/protein folding accessory domain-containing protein n=1 Tax=Jeotgalicoccus saudimassiliensis TaxID=1461582 RepID=A0A078M0S0_9STAP|nr:GrpB family protein [Jeotgalicoccus saudimassiliensis]CDZ98997.1 dephospho-CoA kinase/protein folding accessory domain-containing protein [Jeotgalicoccus saudimassiliensis]